MLEMLDFWWERNAIKWVSMKGKEKVAEDHKVIGSSKSLASVFCPSGDFGSAVLCSCHFRYLHGLECASGSLWCVC